MADGTKVVTCPLVVLLDTSPSMRQVASPGISVMDSAKSFVENLLSQLQQPSARVDLVALYTGALRVSTSCAYRTQNLFVNVSLTSS